MKIVSKLGLSALSGALVLALAACSGPINSMLDETSAAAIEPFATEIAASQIAMMSSAPTGIAPASSVSSLSTASALLSPSGITPQQTTDCTDVSGDQTDTDGDGVPANATYSYNCQDSGTDSSGKQWSSSLTGTLNVQDTDNSNSASYSMTTHLDSSYTYDGSTLLSEVDGSHSVTLTGLVYASDTDLTYRLSLDGESMSFTYDFVQEYTADSSTAPFDLGTLSFEGAFTFVYDGKLYRLETHTDPDLRRDASCAVGFSSGTVHLTDSAGNSITVTYSCSSANATFTPAP